MSETKEMLPKSNDEKMSLFFSAIEDISTKNDGSIVIEWKNNVFHSIKGSHVVNCEGYNINNGRETHLNPPWDFDKVKRFELEDIQSTLTETDHLRRLMMSHKFVIKEGDDLLYFDNYEDIPKEFDHLIKFEPEIPEGPHTEEQHEEIEQWNYKIQELMKRERK